MSRYSCRRSAVTWSRLFSVVLVAVSLLPASLSAATGLTLETSSILFYAIPPVEDSIPQEQDPALDSLGPLANPAPDFEKIRERIGAQLEFCETCHSAELTGSNDFLPILRGQSRYYLYQKIKLFKGRGVTPHPFPGLFAQLSARDRIDLSLFYAMQPSRLTQRSVQVNPGWREESEPDLVSLASCQSCHGKSGDGSDEIPDISGQNAGYLGYRVRQLADDSSQQYGGDRRFSCQIEPVTIAQSRDMAALLNLVVDDQRVSRGKPLYARYCAGCHEGEGTPDFAQAFAWYARIRTGLERYIETSYSDKNRFTPPVNPGLSRNQWRDVVHYLLDRSSRTGRQAPQ